MSTKRVARECHPLFFSYETLQGFSMILKLSCRTLAAIAFLVLTVPASNAQNGPAPSREPGAAALAVARALVQGERFEEALSVLRPVAQDDPESTDILFLIGLAATEASQRPGTAEAGPGRAAGRGHRGSEHHPDRRSRPGARPSGAGAGRSS